MVGSKDIIFEIYRDSRTVLRINDIALLAGEVKDSALSKKLHYYIKTGKLLNPRKGFYAKTGYNPEELACLLYTPTYISLEYVLQRAGIIFQFNSSITCVSYLNRKTESDGKILSYRQVKGEILSNTAGIILNKNNINIASPERAFLDMLYLNKNFYFDNLNIINKKIVALLLPVYNSPTLTIIAKKILQP